MNDPGFAMQIDPLRNLPSACCCKETREKVMMSEEVLTDSSTQQSLQAARRGYLLFTLRTKV